MATREIETKFYKFGQNNSGGSFDIDDDRGIGVVVWIEAANRHDAENRAESIGIYFNGVADGMDCACCGDRWSEPWDDDAEEKPKINTEYDFGWHDTVYVHHYDGSIERIKAPAKHTLND
jgi:hypothetical protein